MCEKLEDAVEGKSHDEIEKLFWKTIKFSSPLYGSDSPGTIFDPKCGWNLNEIQNPLKDGLNYVDMKGITSPYLYFGCWKSMFSFHKEDMDLHSINYMHFGKPKHWYGIPVHLKDKFELLLIKLFPEAYKSCIEFHRHKTFLIHPAILVENGIEVYKCVQEVGDFVVTQGGSFHGGFNYGINCAEAVNFCTSNWLYVGKDAKACLCQPHAVELSIPSFLENLNRNVKDSKLLENYNKVAKALKIEIKVPSINSINWIRCDNKNCQTWFNTNSNLSFNLF